MIIPVSSPNFLPNQTAFEVPLNNVSHCVTAKNEVTLEFHQNDDAAVSLYEMRFHVPVGPGNESVDKDKDKDKEEGGEDKDTDDDAVDVRIYPSSMNR